MKTDLLQAAKNALADLEGIMPSHDPCGDGHPGWETIEELKKAIKEHDPETKPRIAVIIEGGNVSQVLSDSDVEVLLVDYDTEGAEPDELTSVPQGDLPPDDAHVVSPQVDKDVSTVNMLFGL